MAKEEEYILQLAEDVSGRKSEILPPLLELSEGGSRRQAQIPPVAKARPKKKKLYGSTKHAGVVRQRHAQQPSPEFIKAAFETNSALIAIRAATIIYTRDDFTQYGSRNKAKKAMRKLQMPLGKYRCIGETRVYG